jgi:hypothetical protein
MRVLKQKNMVIGPEGHSMKSGCAVESQQQFIWNTVKMFKSLDVPYKRIIFLIKLWLKNLISKWEEADCDNDTDTLDFQLHDVNHMST